MFKVISHRRFTTVVAIAAAGLTASLPATIYAQEQVAPLEEIIVTAQKRSQSLQDVSMSISAFSGDALETRNIEDFADLQFSVPNVISDGNRIAIRGVGNNAASTTAEGGLGYHINGVYLNRPQAGSNEYFDVERLEVLRGPQGTLYGRNTTAGVINIITKKPTEELGGDLSVTLGNYNTRKIKGALNIPISDNVRQRFAGFWLERDGYSTNLFTGNDVDGRDSYELRSSTSIDFSDKLSADLVISYLKEDSNRLAGGKGVCTRDSVLGCSPLSFGFDTPDATGNIFHVVSAIAGGGLISPGDWFADTNNPNDYRTVNRDIEDEYMVDQFGVSLELNYEIGNYNLTSLTGYYETEVDVIQDFDRFVPSVNLNFPVTYRANGRDVITTDQHKSGRRDPSDSEQFSQELRIASDYDGMFNFLLGAYYFDETRVGQVIITSPALALGQQNFGLELDAEFFNVQVDPLKNKSLALFGEGYFDLSEQTRLTLGLRYTDDEKSIRQKQNFFIFVDTGWVESESDWQELTGKVTIEHALNDDSMVFATLAKGYKAGGVNPGAPTDFEPEFINMFEVGSKNTFLDGRLQANFGAFFYDYEDLQLGAVSPTATLTVNGDATVKGVEAEFAFAATDRLLVDFNLAWLDFSIDDFASGEEADPQGIAPGTVPLLDGNGEPVFFQGNLAKNLDGNAVRNAPEKSFKIGAEYTANISEKYELTGRVDYYWQDDYFATEFNKSSDVIDSWQQMDAQLVLRPMDADWSVRAFVKNIQDNDDIIRNGQDGPLVGRFRTVSVLEPRTYGVELRFPF
ncbi:MAG: iron complex outermembrane receptor protein [Cryomorphaceae bacterium]|jgi:iron complex outermembrane receptor protein